MVTATIGGAMYRRGGACAGVNGDRTGGAKAGGGRGEGFCDVGMVRVFFFFFELGGEGFLSHKEFRRQRFARANRV